MPRAALAILMLAFAAAPAAGDASDSPGWSAELAKQVMSPFCPGLALSECPSPQAEQLRQWIIAQEQAGAGRAETEQRLYEVWGDQLRHSPRAQGIGILAYAVPGAAILLGGAIALGFLRRQSRRGGSRRKAETAPAPDEPELAALVDREIGL